jgi:hypothetical protein
MLALAGTAQAKQIQQYFYSGEFFDAGGSHPAAIAVDSVNQKVIVVGNGDKDKGLKISKFQLNGDPAGFSGHLGSTSFNTGDSFNTSIQGEVPPAVAIAVDESGTATDGNFYITLFESAVVGDSRVYGYAPSGTPLPGFPISGRAACGLTVAPDGNLWVASGPGVGAYVELTTSARLTGESLSVGAAVIEGSGEGICRIAIDSSGNFYVAKGQNLAKYDSERHFVGYIGKGAFGFFNLGSPLLALDRGNDTLFELFAPASDPIDPVVQVDSSGNPIAAFGNPDPAHFSYEGLDSVRALAVDWQTHKVYVLDGEEIEVFSQDPSVLTVPTTNTEGVEDLSGTSATVIGKLDPDGADTTNCHFEWGSDIEEMSVKYTHVVPCVEGDVFEAASGENTVTAAIGGLEKGVTYNYRLVGKNANGIEGASANGEFNTADPPALGEASASHISTDSARIALEVNPNGEETHYRVEVGTDTSYGRSFPVPDASIARKRRSGFEGIEVILDLQNESLEVRGLAPDTFYHYRVVAENAAGTTKGTDHTFRTFPLPGIGADPCAKGQVRQQTSSAGLLDCRAYELVSAPYTGGYDVRSDLSPEVAALATSPRAGDQALYSMRSGTIPGINGHPTNRGADPYVATRGAGGWSTRYVGLPSNNSFAGGPFASPLSGFDSALDSFAFASAEICAPCFEDGSTNAPLRLADGTLVKGMAGSMDPGPAQPAGTVTKPLSADGSHFVFGTTSQFEPQGNSNGTDATIYARDLSTKTTEVVSTDDSGVALANSNGVAELDISKDGTRTVIGELISTDSAGNDYFHLYLHIAGTDESVDLTPGTITGALYDGMSADGSKIFFTTTDPLVAGETDESADIYETEVNGPGATTPKLVSNGTGGTGDTDLCSPPGAPDNWNTVSGAGKCNAVAFAGGAGVAAGDGTFYFLSPELLDGASNGTQDQPNLYLVSPGSSTPRFVATIDSSAVKPPPASPTRPVVTTEFGGSHSSPQAMSVDQSNGDVYVTEGSSRLSRFTSSGTPHNFTEGPGAATNTIAGLSFVEFAPEVAIDNSGGLFDGDIYVTNAPGISVFSPTGKLLGQLTGFGEVCGVAVDQSNGSVYASDCAGQRISRYAPTLSSLPVSNANYSVTAISVGMEAAAVAADNGNVYSFPWSSGPVKHYEASEFEAGSPSVFGTLLGANANALSVDPASHELYVDEGSQITAFNPAGEKQLTIGSGKIGASRGVAVNSTSHHIYASSGSGVTEFGYDVPSYEPIDNPAIIHAVKRAGTYNSADFEVTPSGHHAAFSSVMPLDGYENGGHYEVFRYETQEAGAPACVSCSVTTARPESDATLTPYGLSLTEDGRVFFTTGEQLTLRDSNERKDAYEWENGTQQLISTGTSPSDSELLSVSSDGRNAFFFTRQKLVPEDENGSTVRLYSARENGGFEFGPPQFSCAASDECHGASTTPAPPLTAGTTAGTPGQFSEKAPTKCRKGKVKRRGKCVSRHPHERHNHKRAAKAPKGDGK